MNIYEKVLIELTKGNTLKSKHNNLMKLFYSTEDTYLKYYLHKHCKCIKQALHYIQNGTLEQIEDAIDSSFHYVEELGRYCNQMIECEKPEWQIIAERNGWGPLR